ncbi:MAG TPA: TetR/AcrR family transcriptional regulator [Streptosporangiaceae bacterium]|jgi:AcrR family transcriptional regulator|nr:TetR/AcrR family transcriptional regulator [Streptosporangiaceae bacterium]
MATPAETPPSPVRKPAGRKRDTRIYERIRQAGMEIFTAAGWRGFTFDSIAKAAGVGKSSLYLRYSSREELLLDVVEALGYTFPEGDHDHGSIDTDLREFARSYAQWLDGPHGLLSMRMNLESRLNPELGELLWLHTGTQVSRAHRIVRRAKQRGEIPTTASTAVILDALLGGLLNHTMSAPSREPFSTANGRRFVDELARSILDGVRRPVAS